MPILFAFVLNSQQINWNFPHKLFSWKAT